MVRAANSSVMSSLGNLNGSNNKVSVERVDAGGPPPGNALVPRSDAAPGAAGAAVSTAPAASGSADNTAVPELQNDLQPATSGDPGGAPEKAPPQVNDAAPVASGAQPAPAASSSGTPAPAAAANPTTESTSKKKKKKLLGIF